VGALGSLFLGHYHHAAVRGLALHLEVLVSQMDKYTLRALLREAKSHLKHATKEFEDTDCYEAMNAMYVWGHVVQWLKKKLTDASVG
jgi:hypothetical protein